MSLSLSEQLTAQFYDWELRGRGWLEYGLSVDLEPPFHPFVHHSVTSAPVVDDGRIPNIFERVINIFQPKKPPPLPEEDENPIIPFLFERQERITIFSVTLPKGYKVGMTETEQLLVMLSNTRYPLSFEIIANTTSISLQFVSRVSDSHLVQSQVKAYFPECIIKERTDGIEQVIANSTYGAVIDFGLRDEFMLPLAMPERLDSDPFIGLFATLDSLKEGEQVVLQILFSGTLHPWAQSIMRSVTGSDGKAFFGNAPQMLPLAQEKVSSPLFAVSMRILMTGNTEQGLHFLTNLVQPAFVRFFNSPHNSLIPLQTSLSFEDRVDNMLLRESQRLGMLLNSKELANIVHFPSASVTTSKLERDTRKTKSTPAITEGHTLVLGTNSHNGKDKNVTVSNTQRLKHTHIIGATGTGKSTFLINLITQDIQNGEGVCVLDPHGDLIESLLAHIPENRTQDVVIIDPADAEFPIGFNILSAHSEIEKDILSSDLVSVFKRLSTSWGDQMNSVFANAVLAFLESSKGGTLVDLRRFLVEKSFRDNYLKSVSDPSILYYWQKEYPLLKTNSIGSILTRLDTFLRPKLIRNMVAQKKSLDFEQILDSGKIVLVKLSQGLIGNENSYLLGTFFVTKIYQAAMARQAKGKDARKDFFMYIDEFQNFITPSISAILSGARKYHLGLILAHQDMQQLLKYDTELASSVVANAGTRICFRLGDTDAKRFESGFSFFERQDLENLNTGQAIARIERPDFDFSLETVPLADADPTKSEQTKAAAIAYSRTSYGTPKEDVEKLLTELIADTQVEPAANAVTTKEPIIEFVPYSKTETKSISPEQEAETTDRLVRQKQESRHRYLQNLVKKMAESRGYVATLEERTPDGSGRVDVSLQKGGKRIACEICVTTEVQWELHNIQKCLAAGYDIVVECSDDAKVLEQIQKKIETELTEEEQKRVLLYEPEHFFHYLDNEAAKETSTETRIKGYRVKVEYSNASENNAEQKKNTIMKAISDSVRNKKKDT
jgi:DNA helicase HerA-like ATPase